MMDMDMDIDKVNLPLLRKGVEWVIAQDQLPLSIREWNQEFWRVSGDEINRECGTAYCLAGYVCEVSNVTWMTTSDDVMDAHLVNVNGDVVYASDQAQNLLNIDPDVAESLFHFMNSASDIVRIARIIAMNEGEDWSGEFLHE